MRGSRTKLPWLLTGVLLVPGTVATSATSNADAQALAGPSYAGVWKAHTLQHGANGATFKFRVKENNRVRWVKGHYTLKSKGCEEGWTFQLTNRHAPIQHGTFTVRGRAGVDHLFVVNGTMLSTTKAKGSLQIGPKLRSGWGCPGVFRFTWRGHRL